MIVVYSFEWEDSSIQSDPTSNLEQAMGREGDSHTEHVNDTWVRYVSKEGTKSASRQATVILIKSRRF